MSTYQETTGVIAFFVRKERQAADRLTDVRERSRGAQRDLEELHRRLEETGSLLRAGRDATIDIAAIRRVDDCRAMLRAAIDRKRLEIETLDREEEERQRELTEAGKRRRIWSKVGSRTAADADRDADDGLRATEWTAGGLRRTS